MDRAATSIPMTLLVEGRVAVKVPAQWAVRRITSGPGSARVQVTAPDDATAVLITQSQVRKGESLSATAATLRSALDDEQAGVFSPVQSGRPPGRSTRCHISGTPRRPPDRLGGVRRRRRADRRRLPKRAGQ